MPANAAPVLEPLAQSLKDAQADAAADAAERFTIDAADDEIAEVCVGVGRNRIRVVEMDCVGVGAQGCERVPKLVRGCV